MKVSQTLCSIDEGRYEFPSKPESYFSLIPNFFRNFYFIVYIKLWTVQHDQNSFQLHFPIAFIKQFQYVFTLKVYKKNVGS